MDGNTRYQCPRIIAVQLPPNKAADEKKLNAVNTGATMKSSIALYIPPNSMKTGFSAEYSGQEGAALKAAAFTGAKGAASAGANAFLGQGSLQAGVGNLAGMMADSLT